MDATLSALRRELAELDALIAETESVAEEETDAFAWQLSLRSLKARRETVIAEMDAELAAARVAKA